MGRLRFTVLAGVCALGMSAMAACSSESPADAPRTSTNPPDGDAGFVREGSVYDSSPSPESGLGELLFRPDSVYTGIDGTRAFKVPVAVYDGDADLVVTVSDPGAVTIAKTTLKNPVSPSGVTDNGQYYMLTALKAGTFTLTAASKGRTTTASLTIPSYASNRFAAGEVRYTAAGIGTRRPCTDCHAGTQGVDHSPAALATATDQDVGVIITTGVKPGPGGSTSIIKIPSEPGTSHTWDVTGAEQDGLVTFLRALEPRGFQ